MKLASIALVVCLCGILQGCSSSRKSAGNHSHSIDVNDIKSTVIIKNNPPSKKIDVKSVQPGQLVDFALTLVGVPYKYGSAKKETGFDCSGFVNYVFNHFSIKVPRTTVEFTNAGKAIAIKDSRPGDIILFTGSDANSGVVGHMGIITTHDRNNFRFIHAASGKGVGVIISEMNSYFIPRFVKVIRVFPPW